MTCRHFYKKIILLLKTIHMSIHCQFACQFFSKLGSNIFNSGKNFKATFNSMRLLSMYYIIQQYRTIHIHHFPWPERKYANLHQCFKLLTNMEKKKGFYALQQNASDINPEIFPQYWPLKFHHCSFFLPSQRQSESACVCSLLTKAITQRFVHTAECAAVHHHRQHTLIKSPRPLSRCNKPHEAN